MIARCQENDSFQKNYCWKRPVDKVRLDALFVLMYFRGHYIFGAIMSKHCFKFLKSHLSFDDSEEYKTLWDNNRFAVMREV